MCAHINLPVIIIRSAIIIFSLLLFLPLVVAQPGKLLIVTTFPNLVEDVKLVASEEETVSLVPAGADPHDYQLTSRDLDLIREANLIVSTAHTSFEVDLRRKIEQREFSATLVELTKIPGIAILNNPVLNQPNYHMPIYDPRNYKLFVKYLALKLAELNPLKAKIYLNRANNVAKEVDSLIESTPKLNVIAAADYPFTQYAVSWLGVEIRYLIVKEAGVSATPSDIEKLKEALARKEVKLVVVAEPVELPASKLLKSLAEKYDVPVLYVPLPFSSGSILSKLKYIASQAKIIKLQVSEEETLLRKENPLIRIIAGVLSLLIIAELYVYYWRVRE